MNTKEILSEIEEMLNKKEYQNALNYIKSKKEELRSDKVEKYIDSLVDDLK